MAGLDKDYVQVACLRDCSDGGTPGDTSVGDAVTTDTSVAPDASCGFDPGFDAATLESNLDFAGWPMPNSNGSDSNPHSWTYPEPGIIDDTMTGLRWRKRPSDVPYTLNQGKAYCQALPGGPWRVPSRLELLTIQHWGGTTPTAGRAAPCFLPDTFEEDDGGSHYSLSSTLFADPDSGTDGWAVATDFCGPVPTVTTVPQYVRCVKGAPAKPKFELSKCGIVRDLGAKLEWQRAVQGNKTFKGTPGSTSIFEYCAALKLGPPGDDSGWRVPTQQEVYSIIDTRLTEPAINQKLFQGVPQSGRILSSTIYDREMGLNVISAVFIETGLQDAVADIHIGYVSCVRSFKKN